MDEGLQGKDLSFQSDLLRPQKGSARLACTYHNKNSPLITLFIKR